MNSDIFQKEQKELSTHQKARVLRIKEPAEALRDFMCDCDGITEASSRELSLAQTKLEECVMWATKHYTK